MKVTRAQLEALRQQHLLVDDSWYSCPKAEGGCADDKIPEGVCWCGADKHNALVDAIIAELFPA